MTNNEINRLIKKYRSIISKNQTTLKNCKQQMMDLQGLRASAAAARIEIQNSKSRRLNTLDRLFPTGSNINFEQNYEYSMKWIIGGDQYNAMITELNNFETSITTRLNRLGNTRSTCENTIREAKRKIRYLESQREN